MRDKHVTRLTQLARACREQLHPYDWDVSSCPQHERRHLLCYEYLRELEWVRDYVTWIRTGTLPSPSYWTPAPTFGWSEWPDLPFLAIPQDERTRRIAAMPRLSDDWLEAIPILPTGAPSGETVIQIPVPLSPHISREKLISAFAALLRAYGVGQPPQEPKAGHTAPRIRPGARIAGLAIYRLRRYFSAYDALTLMEYSSLQGACSDEANLERARRQTERHLARFSLRARDEIQAGRWFFPFAATVI